LDFNKIILKGYSINKDEICSNLLQSVSLTKDRNVLCQHLSTGMKRRLSIACAFIGNTKLVLLGKIFILKTILSLNKSIQIDHKYNPD
jgi:ABC-type multidrug transport system ATPase subunit